MDKVIELTYELKEELNSLPLFQEYKSHPLMVNYDALEKEVSEYLLEICEIINKK